MDNRKLIFECGGSATIKVYDDQIIDITILGIDGKPVVNKQVEIKDEDLEADNDKDLVFTNIIGLLADDFENIDMDKHFCIDHETE